MSFPVGTLFVLASGSPRRLELLKQIGLSPAIVAPSSADESRLPRERPARLAVRLAEEKARQASRQQIGEIVLGADTVVACGRRVLGKPPNEDAARAFLLLLSGRRHMVFSGVCVIDKLGQSIRRLVATSVSFKRLADVEVESYIRSGEWTDKAGGYAIQGRAAAFVRRINGSYTNVVGLPLFEIAKILAGLGVRTEP